MPIANAPFQEKRATVHSLDGTKHSSLVQRRHSECGCCRPSFAFVMEPIGRHLQNTITDGNIKSRLMMVSIAASKDGGGSQKKQVKEEIYRM